MWQIEKNTCSWGEKRAQKQGKFMYNFITSSQFMPI
jgi:hypothetical protein